MENCLKKNIVNAIEDWRSVFLSLLRLMSMLVQAESNALFVGPCAASCRTFVWRRIFLANAHPIGEVGKASLFLVLVAIEH